MIELSILIPVYNAEAFLQETFDSVLVQAVNLDRIEVVVVNDGSTDKSLSVIRHYESRFPHFKYIVQKNGGVSRARNRGLELVSGKYVTFLDADDTFREGALPQVLETIKKRTSDIFFFDDIYAAELETYEKGEFLSRFFYSVYVWKTCINVQFLKEKGLRFSDGYILEDGVFLLESVLRSSEIATRKLCTVFYRENAKSLTRNYSDQKKNREMVASFVFVINKYRQLMDEAKDELSPQAIHNITERKEGFIFFLIIRMIRYGYTNKQMEENLQKVQFDSFRVFPGAHHDKFIYKLLAPALTYAPIRKCINSCYSFFNRKS